MAELQTLADELPDGIKGYYGALLAGKDSELKESEALYVFFGKTLSILANMPQELSQRIAAEDIDMLRDKIFDALIVTLLIAPVYESSQMEKFEWGGEVFYLPISDIDVVGDRMPYASGIAKEMCVASDVCIGANFRLAALTVAILCRPQGEEYNENAAKKRAKIFEGLPAAIYLEVFTQLFSAHSYLQGEYPYCYGMNENGARLKGKGKPSTWCDRMLYVADDKPSELPIVEKMLFYDFMQLLNGKIKRQRE